MYVYIYMCIHTHTHVHTPHFLYTFIHTFGNIYIAGYCKLCCYEHMNIGVSVSFRIRFFIFSGSMPRSVIDGPYDNSIFHFLIDFHNILCSDCASFYFHP